MLMLAATLFDLWFSGDAQKNFVMHQEIHVSHVVALECTFVCTTATAATRSTLHKVLQLRVQIGSSSATWCQTK